MDAQTIIARRVAKELRAGDLVNLGIGIPTLVANYVPPDLKVFFQSENGLIGTGPIPEQGLAHPLLTDAGGRPISALPGARTSAASPARPASERGCGSPPDTAAPIGSRCAAGSLASGRL